MRQHDTLTRKFERCVQAVKRTVKAKDKQSAAVAICTKTILFPRGRTIKRFASVKGKMRLVTQKKSKLSN